MYEKWIPIENMPSAVNYVFTVSIKDDVINGLRILLNFHDYPKTLKISPNTKNIKLPYRVCGEELILLQDNNLPLKDNGVWHYFYKLKKSDFIDEFYSIYGYKFEVEHYCIFSEDYNFKFLSFIDNPPIVEWISKDRKV
jgi:hypothetical protein